MAWEVVVAPGDHQTDNGMGGGCASRMGDPRVPTRLRTTPAPTILRGVWWPSPSLLEDPDIAERGFSTTGAIPAYEKANQAGCVERI